MDPTVKRVLLLRNDDRELRRMSRWFRQIATEIGLDDAQTDDMELCLNELVANVIRHAYTEHGARDVRVLAEGGSGVLRLTVEDDGRPFDPRGEPPPARPDSLDRAQVGGWGLPIIRALANEVFYERRGQWNRVTITSRGASAEPPSEDTI